MRISKLNPLLLLISTFFLGAACSNEPVQLEILFPNDAARVATDELEIFVYSRESGFGATDVRCSERLGRFEEGKDLEIDPFLGTLIRPFEGQEIPNFPTENTVLVVVGFVRIDAEQRYEYLEGCIEDFGDEVSSQSITVRLDFVRPNGEVVIEKIAGDLQVSLVGAGNEASLEVRASAKYQNAPRPDALYPLPGLRFTVQDTEGVSVNEEVLPPAKMLTDRNGELAIPITIEKEGSFEISVTAEGLSDETVLFEVSGILPYSIKAEQIEVISLPGNSEARQIATGNVGGGDETDLVILRCDGEVERCKAGSLASDMPGASVVSYVLDIESAATSIVNSISDSWLAPGGLVVAELMPGGTFDDVAILNSRRNHSSGGTSRISEGSEIVILQDLTSSGLTSQSFTLNSSNAVGLLEYKHSRDAEYSSLLTVSQGRKYNLQQCDDQLKCSLNQSALTFEPCPAGEFCDCAGEGCFCRADDRFIDKLKNNYQAGRQFKAFVNVDKCHQPEMTCEKTNSNQSDPETSCFCEGGRVCPGESIDYCRCRVPRRDLIGSVSSPSFPKQISAGVLQAGDNLDVVVAADSGMRLLKQTTRNTWSDRGFPILSNVPDVTVLEDVNRDSVTDLIWLSSQVCMSSRCEIKQASITQLEASEACMGVVLRSSNSDELIGRNDLCQSYPLPSTATAVCAAKINDDNALDLVVGYKNLSEVSLFLGNGKGGFLSTPIALPLPNSHKAETLLCEDLDEDGIAEIVIADGSGAAVVILGSKVR